MNKRSAFTVREGIRDAQAWLWSTTLNQVNEIKGLADRYSIKDGHKGEDHDEVLYLKAYNHTIQNAIERLKDDNWEIEHVLRGYK